MMTGLERKASVRAGRSSSPSEHRYQAVSPHGGDGRPRLPANGQATSPRGGFETIPRSPEDKLQAMRRLLNLSDNPNCTFVRVYVEEHKRYREPNFAIHP